MIVIAIYEDISKAQIKKTDSKLFLGQNFNIDCKILGKTHTSKN